MKWYIFIPLGAVFFAINLYAQQWNFEHRVLYVGLQRPDDVFVADFDKDGWEDIVVSEDVGISWFKNPGKAGSHWQRFNPVCPDTTLREFMAMCTGDFDGDGDPDVCACEKQSKQAFWFENTLRQDGGWISCIRGKRCSG